MQLNKDVVRGSKGKDVKTVQEWLCLHEFGVVVDGKFGPATEQAVRGFQQAKGLLSNGVVGEATFSALINPVTEALKPLPAATMKLGDLTVAYAEQHLRQRPREVGGNNMGPWVRMYLGGREGEVWAWCAGFVCFVLKQACDTIGVPMPIRRDFMCTVLAGDARKRGIFHAGSEIQDKTVIGPGSLYLWRKSEKSWKHVGVVVKAHDDAFESIDGNTNGLGSRDGFEVCRRRLGYKDRDFIIFQ